MLAQLPCDTLFKHTTKSSKVPLRCDFGGISGNICVTPFVLIPVLLFPLHLPAKGHLNLLSLVFILSTEQGHGACLQVRGKDIKDWVPTPNYTTYYNNL